MMAYQVEVKDRPAQHTIGLHTHSPMQDLPTLIPQSNRAVEQYLASVGKQPNGAFFVGYYNMDMQNLDVEIGFFSTEKVAGNGNIQSGTIPAGKAASIMYVGSYAGLGQVHGALHDWMSEQGYESATGYYEVYLNDPADTPEDKLKTEVFTLLKD